MTKRYDSVTALDDYTLEVAAGELMVFVGLYGCVKTTALRMVSKLSKQRRITNLATLSCSWTSACPSWTGSRQLVRSGLLKKTEANVLGLWRQLQR